MSNSLVSDRICHLGLLGREKCQGDPRNVGQKYRQLSKNANTNLNPTHCKKSEYPNHFSKSYLDLVRGTRIEKPGETASNLVGV